MSSLGALHPVIVHTPIALLIFSAFFAVVGRLFDREWLRKAAVLMLVFGFLGAVAAMRTGLMVHEVPEHDQGVPEAAIDAHGDLGQITVYVSGAALIAVVIATRLAGGAAAAVSMLALLLQLAAAVLVGITGYRGGKLVYEHGASVRVGGVLVKDVAAGRAPGGPGAAPGTQAPRDEDHDEHH